MNNILYIIFILAISVTFIQYSNKNVFGITFKRLTNFNSFSEALLVLCIVGFIASFIIDAICHFITNVILINKLELNAPREIINHMSSNASNNFPSNNSFPNNTPSNNSPQYPYHYPVQDPVRY